MRKQLFSAGENRLSKIKELIVDIGVIHVFMMGISNFKKETKGHDVLLQYFVILLHVYRLLVTDRVCMTMTPPLRFRD